MMRYTYGSIWRSDFKQGTRLQVDLTCDGADDWVFAWRDGVNPERDYFSVALVSNPGGPVEAGWKRFDNLPSALLTLGLPVGTGEQFGLCDNRQEPYGSGYKTTVAEIPNEAHRRFSLPDTCRSWLRIDDGMCDVFHVGYDPAKGTFVLNRN